MNDKFTIAVVVLVVLAQLVGALATAWKNRRPRDDGSRSGGGLVVVENPGSGSARSSSNRSSSSWGSDDESAPESWQVEDEDDEDELQTWDEHRPGELPQAPVPPPHRHRQTTRAPGTTDVAAFATSLAARPVAAERMAQSSGPRRSDRPSRARQILSRGNLRQAMVARILLEPPPSLRRLRP